MRCLLAIVLIACTAPALADPMPVPRVIGNAIDGFIRPGFAALAESAGALENGVSALCETPSEGTLTAAQDEFRTVVAAFSRVELVRFGPLSQDNRLDRLFFWPDRKGIGLKQVQALLAGPPEQPLDMEAKSVALQGLGALEFVLFGSGAETLAGAGGSNRCTYAGAIAASIAKVTAEIAADWQAPDGIAARMLNPTAENTDFRNHTEVLEALSGALAHGVEAVRDTRLMPFIGPDGKTYKPKSAPFWRSGMTGPALRASVEGWTDLYAISAIGLATGEENLWVDNGIRFELANAQRAADLLTAPVEEALADPAQARAYAYLLILTRSLQVLLGENLPAALGLSVGFSSLDGD